MILLKILTYICVPLIIGYVTVVVAKRREVEMDVRRDFMSRRIEAYVAIHAFMRRSSLMIAPPMYMEGILFSCLNGTGFEIEDQNMEYASHFRDYSSLQEYVKELSTLILRHDVYIEPSIKTELSNMERWYRELILALDVFRQTEADERLDVPAEFQEAKMRFACNLAGTALQADVNAFSERLERILSEKLRHPRLRYWYDDKDYSPEYDSFSSSQLVTKSSMLGVLFLFVHVSQWYSRDEFDELEEKERNRLFHEFFTVFGSKMKR